MKAWRDLSSVAKPPGIAALPLDQRGYPIPWIVVHVNGKPDFRVLDEQKIVLSVRERICSLCGQPLGPLCYFAGGPLSFGNHFFSDPPVHRECGEYAMQVCPFLAAPKFGYSALHGIPGLDLREYKSLSTERPALFVLAGTSDCKFVHYQGEVLIQAGLWREYQMWRHGTLLTN